MIVITLVTSLNDGGEKPNTVSVDMKIMKRRGEQGSVELSITARGSRPPH